MSQSPDLHRGHRFPAEIIAHAVWLYHVFSLSLRDVELLLAERGVTVSYESVRRWCLKFGRSFADKLRRRRPRPGDGPLNRVAKAGIYDTCIIHNLTRPQAKAPGYFYATLARSSS